MGEQFYEEASAYIWPNRQTPNDIVNKYFADMETETYPEGTNLLEETFSQLSDLDIQMILRETDMHDLLKAFRGSSKKIQLRLCSNLNKHLGSTMLIDSIGLPMPITDEIIRAQQKMLNQLTALRAGIPGAVTIVNHLRSERSGLSQEEMNSLLSAAADETT
jgi:polyhydroxyalkanoate synthesis regulator protein